MALEVAHDDENGIRLQGPHFYANDGETTRAQKLLSRILLHDRNNSFIVILQSDLIVFVFLIVLCALVFVRSLCLRAFVVPFVVSSFPMTKPITCAKIG